MSVYEMDPKDSDWLVRLEKRLLTAREQARESQADYWDMIDALRVQHPDEDDAHE